MLQKATFAAGCFWCTEAIFKRLKGVIAVVPGYSGGQSTYPTYEKVCSGQTGYAEAIQITFDPAIISYTTLVELFWHTHDPTSLNRQGADIGTQYRSVIFDHDDSQRKIAQESKERIEKEKVFDKKIVTQIVPLTYFYPAESYHRNYYDKNPDQAYCRVVIDPKIKKLLADFSKEVKEEYRLS